ncbi:MAG: DUF3168 domain-containing protein [Jhaorihella sp.]
MSYGVSVALQEAVYRRLLDDPAVSGLVGAGVYDALPDGPVPETYVSLGPEDVRDRSDAEGAGALHRFTVSVISEARGFAAAKTVAGAVGDALLHGELALTRGRLVGLWFERASARRSGRAGQVRRIDLRFRARVEDN